MKSFLAFLLLARCCLALDYSQLEETGSSCSWRHSCASPDMSRNFSERGCECDRLCGSFGDCCIDSPLSGPFQNDLRRCMAYGVPTAHNTGAYVIGACPTGSDPISAERCGSPPDMTDPLLESPVTVPGGATYYNVHCAECNHANLSRLVRWRTLLACDSLAHHNLSRDTILNGLERSGDGHWGVLFRGKFHRCKLLYDRPASVRNLRLCRAGVLSTCPPGGGDNASLCRSYEAVVYTSMFVAYRNPHCAFCNGVADDEPLFCDPDEIMSGRRKFSFALLLDVRTQDGDLVGVKQSSCSEGTKYDPFTKSCRNLLCAIPGYSLVGNDCVKDA